jgi:hypothetical protein
VLPRHAVERLVAGRGRRVDDLDDLDAGDVLGAQRGGARLRAGDDHDAQPWHAGALP